MNATDCRYRRPCQGLPIALLMICLAVGCSPPVSPRAEVARPVKTMIVAAGGGEHVRAFPGKVEAAKKAVLSFQVPGVLVKLPVKEGQKVAQGEVIAQLRQDEFQARLKAMQGQLDQAQAVLKAMRSGERPEQILKLEAQARAAETKLANARTEFDRAVRLLPSRAISRSDYDLAETTLHVAQEDHKAALQMLEKGSIARSEDIEASEAAVRGLEGRVVEANLQLEDCTLRAPYDGVIAQRFVNQEQSIRANEPVVKFQNVDEIEVAMDVPETVMAADIRSADIVQMVAGVQRGARAPVSGAHHRGRAVGGPDDANLQGARCHEAVARCQRAPRHDGHRHCSPIAAPKYLVAVSLYRSPPFSTKPRGSKWRGSSGRIKPSSAAR